MQKSKCKVQNYGGSPTAQRGRTIDNILRLEWTRLPDGQGSTKLFVDSYELFVIRNGNGVTGV